MAERREHRTPFSAHGVLIVDSKGGNVAVCETAELAAFIAITTTYFDRLLGALDMCRGEFDGITNPQNRPAYAELMKLHDELHAALRG